MTMIVGIGGATCSGKTTLSKHLVRILPQSFIVHQDDFAPPEATLPIKQGWADWDAPTTARMAETLDFVRKEGKMPHDFKSHDHLNEQQELDVPDAQIARWKQHFSKLPNRVVLADGFLLYYNLAVRKEMDVRILLRTPRELLKRRREERKTYATAGTTWQDPQGYFDTIVWPAYVEAHQRIFQGDLETSETVKTDKDDEDGGPVRNLLVLDNPKHHQVTLECASAGLAESMAQLLESSLLAIAHSLN